MVDVSVIVATYNSDIMKIRKTLYSIIRQQNINFEIIVCDDGSCDEKIDELTELVKLLNYDIRIIKNSSNKGTIINCLSGLYTSKGRYVFLTSPGDLLFDNNTLHDFYYMALQYPNCKIFFGTANYYSIKQNDIKTDFKEKTKPSRPVLFKAGRSAQSKRVSYFYGNSILGAAFFRERVTAIKYFEHSVSVGKYTEDRLSTGLALMDNLDVIFLDRKIIWYELGTGISTSHNEKWNNILQQEQKKLADYIKDNYSDNPISEDIYYSYHSSNKFKRIFHRALKHPLLMLRILCNHFVPVRYNQCSENEKEELLQMLA